MPSPVGHSLIGLAVGALAALAPDDWRGLARQAWQNRWPLLGAIALANAPDIDYLPGLLTGELNAYHHLLTHTAGWCGVVSVGCWMLVRAVRSSTRVALLGWCLLLTGSHLLADWLTADTRPPIGIMALWPCTDNFYIAPHTIFPRLLKHNLGEILQWHNAQAVAVEVVWCLPAVMAVLLAKRCGSKRNAAR